VSRVFPEMSIPARRRAYGLPRRPPGGDQHSAGLAVSVMTACSCADVVRPAVAQGVITVGVSTQWRRRPLFEPSREGLRHTGDGV